jgi:hypothetical protein
VNTLDHYGQLNRARSGARRDYGYASTAPYIQQQKLIAQVRKAFDALSPVQLAMFWMHNDFGRFSKEDRSAEHVYYRLEQASDLDELCEMWAATDNSLHELVARLLGVRKVKKRRRDE